MKRIGWLIAGLLAGAVLAMQVPSLAQQGDATGVDVATPPSQRSITVTGTATVTSQPDEAIVSLGVHTQADSAQAALQDNAAKMMKVLDALHRAGLTNDDIATTSVSVNPVWGTDGRSVTGYQADDQIQATIHDLSKVGATIDDAVGAGANMAGGVTFQVSDEGQGHTDALAKAIANAKAKAEAMAAAAGANVGDVLTISEASGPTPVPYPMYAAAGAADSAASTPVNPPTIESSVSVTVSWALG
jgi:uncharacterized protein YggE